jgi:hypothetical protein
MRKLILASVVSSTLTSVPAMAYSGVDICRPYMIAMTCDTDMPSCGRPHMVYAPGQSPADSPVGNYFFATPRTHAWRHDRDDTRYRVASNWRHRSWSCPHFHTW